MYKYISFLLLCFIILFLSCHGNEYIVGKVIKIQDGDTYDLLREDKTTLRIRMEGIDAPEKGMPFYRVSKKYLGELCLNQTIKVLKMSEDHHGRTVAYSFLDDGRELSREMLKAGLAWHYKEYNSEEELSDLETEAQNAKRGLWVYDNPMSPWENRQLHRKGISTKDMFNIKEGED
jgi:endonuclease YncB( thermonuclease family)